MLSEQFGPDELKNTTSSDALVPKPRPARRLRVVGEIIMPEGVHTSLIRLRLIPASECRLSDIAKWISEMQLHRESAALGECANERICERIFAAARKAVETYEVEFVHAVLDFRAK